jgi:UDP-glucose 4-epimerase
LALNVGGSDVVTLAALAEAMITANGSGEYQIREFPPERKRIDVGDFLIDDSRFRLLSGWRPCFDLVEGLRRSLKYYRTHLKAYL